MTEHELLQQLRYIAAETTVPDGHAMEARLLAAFATVPRTAPAPASRRFARDYFWAAAAALLLISATLVWHVASTRGGATRTSRTAPAPITDSVLEFVALPGASAFPDLERARIVRIELPLAALPAYGLEMVPDALDIPVTADLLIGQDGLPRGIRLIP